MDNNYSELTSALAKVTRKYDSRHVICEKGYLQQVYYFLWLQRMSDSNIQVVTLSANVIEALALGLREAFAKYKPTVIYHTH